MLDADRAGDPRPRPDARHRPRRSRRPICRGSSPQSARPQRLAASPASERAVAPLAEAARRSGWRVVAASLEATDPLAMTADAPRSDVDGVLVGAGDPPGRTSAACSTTSPSLVAAVAAPPPGADA